MINELNIAKYKDQSLSYLLISNIWNNQLLYYSPKYFFHLGNILFWFSSYFIGFFFSVSIACRFPSVSVYGPLPFLHSNPW